MKKYIPIFLALVLAKWWFTDPSIDVDTNGLSFSYIVEYSGEVSRSDTLPLLVALHGNGDTPQDFYDNVLDHLDVPARIILLKGPVSSNRGSAWPWSPADFVQYGKAINEAVEILAIKFPTSEKPILLGFSGGGMTAYYQALTHGDSYSYIIPISGKLTKDLLGDAPIRRGAKVFAFHGNKDSVVSITGGRSAERILREHGIDVRFVEFNGGHHGIVNEIRTEITVLLEEKLESLY
ncbi:MAG: hypothetical protein COA75_13005 [Cellvibrionales bacterium]|nr:MAG: hypothetical protein COB04_16910 [Gammaproteobacteria bacterium]PCJ34694.1 MAG: hypothetical protein COA75_13005 [Cellvibrionales bacterium]